MRIIKHPNDFNPKLSLEYRKALALAENIFTGVAIGAAGSIGLLVVLLWLSMRH